MPNHRSSPFIVSGASVYTLDGSSQLTSFVRLLRILHTKMLRMTVKLEHTLTTIANDCHDKSDVDVTDVGYRSRCYVVN